MFFVTQKIILSYILNQVELNNIFWVISWVKLFWVINNPNELFWVITQLSCTSLIKEPSLTGNKFEFYDDVINWIWIHRWPLFSNSSLYSQYKLAKFLSNYDLSKNKTIEIEMIKKMKIIQKQSFSKMSKFSSFC